LVRHAAIAFGLAALLQTALPATPITRLFFLDIRAIEVTVRAATP
jgi:hypothetical protein